MIEYYISIIKKRIDFVNILFYNDINQILFLKEKWACIKSKTAF